MTVGIGRLEFFWGNSTNGSGGHDNAVDNSILTLQHNGKVAIGTSSTSGQLHIKNNFTTETKTLVLDAYGQNNSKAKIEMKSIGSGGGYVSSYISQGRGGSISGHEYYIGMGGDANGYALAVTNGGRVGIGTLAPRAALSVTANSTDFNDGNAADQTGVHIGNYRDNNGYTYGFIELVSNYNNGPWIDFKSSAGSQDRDGRIRYGEGVIDGFVFMTDDTQRMVITKAGNVGIGISSPIVPLHIFNSHAKWSSFPTQADGGSFDTDGTSISEPTHGEGGHWVSNSSSEGSYNHGIYLQDYNVTSSPTTANRDINVANKISIYCEGSIIVGGRIYLESDERVKNRIRVIDDNIALDVIRKIECYSYFYNNITTRDENISYGFLAQQVKQHIPNAVKFKKDFLPEAMCFAENIVWEDLSYNTYKLTIPIIHKDNSDNIINYAPDTKFKFFLSDNSSNIFFNEDNMIISTLMDDQKSFIFKKKAEFVFIYGYEVEDFHVLDKEKIFTVHHSAIQEIDKIQQEEKTKLAAAEAKIASLETQLAQVLARLDALENN